ncbi:MAG: GNAT family N-acetyltransferase [Planctomycetia bacterium]|nr:GNAT family N-acetyltransferase [Planctomycetia bacterium]
MTRLTFREATSEDVPELAALHVVTWAATYPHVARPPTLELRERQWRDAFENQDGTWFCYLAVDAAERYERLVGFAKGQDYSSPELPEFAGELSKIYLLQECQRQGWGRQLLGHVVRRFLERGVHSMLLFADAQNPSCRFYEALGAEHLLDSAGQFHGGYGWRNLEKLAEICPAS